MRAAKNLKTKFGGGGLAGKFKKKPAAPKSTEPPT
jgi:hypothetical protein